MNQKERPMNLYIVGRDVEDPGSINYPQEGAILEYLPGYGWQVTVLNDGNPDDHLIGGSRHDVEHAEQSAREWLAAYGS